MALIDSLRNKEGTIVYPKTVTKAIYDYETMQTLEQTINAKFGTEDVIPVENGGTGNKINESAQSVKLTTPRVIQINLELEDDETTFDGTENVTLGVTGVLPIAHGGTGNTTGNAATATKLATARTIQTNLASTTAASFDGTEDISAGVNGVLSTNNGGTGTNNTRQAIRNIGGLSQVFIRRLPSYDDGVSEADMNSITQTGTLLTNVSDVQNKPSFFDDTGRKTVVCFSVDNSSYNGYLAYDYYSGEFALKMGNSTTWKRIVTDQNITEILAKMGGAANPNLLINGDFQVWQRGTSFSTTGFTERYTADRWKAVSTNGNVKLTVQKSDKGIEFFADQDGSAVYFRYQMSEEDLSKIRGKTCTLSYSIDNVISTQTTTISETATEAGILLNIGSSVTTTPKYLNWVKFEEGAVATQFVSRPYAEELAMCQRYFYRISMANCGFNVSNTTYLNIGHGHVSASTRAYIFVSKPQMRKVPTLTYNLPSSGRTYLYYTSPNYVIQSLFLDVIGIKSFVLGVNISAGLEVGASVLFNTTSPEFYIDLNAEI